MDLSPKDLRKVIVFHDPTDDDLDQIVQNSTPTYPLEPGIDVILSTKIGRKTMLLFIEK